jgi:cation transport ATPase
VAMANATDVAKGAASAVLLDEGLSGVLSLIVVGREVSERPSLALLSLPLRG